MRRRFIAQSLPEFAMTAARKVLAGVAAGALAGLLLSLVAQFTGGT